MKEEQKLLVRKGGGAKNRRAKKLFRRRKEEEKRTDRCDKLQMAEEADLPLKKEGAESRQCSCIRSFPPAKKRQFKRPFLPFYRFADAHCDLRVPPPDVTTRKDREETCRDLA